MCEPKSRQCAKVEICANRVAKENVMDDLLSRLRIAARRYRDANPERQGGIVLVFQGKVYGWKNCLRDAGHEQPGAYAVDEDGHVFIAEGGNEYDGAKCWVAVGTSN